MNETQVGKKLDWVVAPEIAVAKRPRRKITPIRQSKRIISIAEKMGWEDVKIIGRGWVDEPTRMNGWLVMPLEQYEKPIPKEALEKIKVLGLMGENVKYLIADDLRKILEKERKEAERAARIKALKDIGAGVASVLGVVTLGALAIAASPLLLLGAGVSVLQWDPLLIAVTEDFEWVSLHKWYD